MTKEQLLIPRIMLTDWYIGCPYKMGTIFTLSKDKRRYENIDGKKLQYVKAKDANNAPANFTRIAWFACRKPQDLPEYISVLFTLYPPIIIKVTSWNLDMPNWSISDIAFDEMKKTGCLHPEMTIQPSTKQEYNKFIKKQSK